MVYAGIGSRKVPLNVVKHIHFISERFRKLGYTLRSGGADGCDKAFEDYAGENKEIYLPWERFNNNKSELHDISPLSVDMAKYYHPAPNSLTSTTLKIMARNCYQVLGEDLDTPVEFIVCYTKDGEEIGGTAQAIRIAKDKGIPIYNIHNNKNYIKILNFIATKL